MPYSTLFRKTGVSVPGVVQPIAIPSSASGEVASGDTLSGHFSLTGFNGSIRLPMGYGSVPTRESALFKLGPVYFFLDDLTARLIYSHVDGHPSGSSEKWVSWINMDITVVADLGDRWNIALRGNLYYLPFQNQFGYGYSSTLPGIAGSLAYMFPSFQAQVAYTFPVGDWPVTIADDFRLVSGDYSNSLSYTLEDIRVGSRNGEDTSVYTFGRQNWGSSAATNLDSFNFGVLANVASISTHKDVFGDFLFSARLSRDDFWYIPAQNTLSSALERFSAQLVSQRETLRFKPFIRYDACHVDGDATISNWLQAGIIGPITENLDFSGEMGYYWGNRDTVTGQIEFRHIMNPTTSENLRLVRGVNLFNDQFITSAVYELDHNFNPQLEGKVFVTGGEYSAIGGDTISNRELRTGVQLIYTPGPKTRISWGNYYGRLEAISQNGHGNFYGSQVDFQYQISPTLECGLVYSFNRGDQYFESYSSAIRNMVVLTLRKAFR